MLTVRVNYPQCTWPYCPSILFKLNQALDLRTVMCVIRAMNLHKTQRFSCIKSVKYCKLLFWNENVCGDVWIASEASEAFGRETLFQHPWRERQLAEVCFVMSPDSCVSEEGESRGHFSSVQTHTFSVCSASYSLNSVTQSRNKLSVLQPFRANTVCVCVYI